MVLTSGSFEKKNLDGALVSVVHLVWEDLFARK